MKFIVTFFKNFLSILCFLSNLVFLNTLILTSNSLLATEPELSQQAEQNKQPEEKAQQPAEKTIDKYQQTMTIVGKPGALNEKPGSAVKLNEDELEKFEFDDIHQILSKVPGVNIRQEDGFGLRPNIGFRGATPERSKKINILEDGVLIGPAPYSAPAAYYFPMVSRLSSLEVFKGPSAILYGPNTVAGTLNLVTRQVSDYDQGMLDIAFGSDGYQKAHAYTINNYDNFGFLVELINVQSDGFKQLENSTDTGFDKNDITTKFRFNLDGDKYLQIFEVKLAYADEVSDETYLGLTDADFSATPYRRYAASQLGHMDWQHTQVQFNHFLQGNDFELVNRIYRNDFDRAWRKLNNFNQAGNPATDRSLQEILQNPNDGINQDYYLVLTGAEDSQGTVQQLLIGTNDRSFFSQGVQSDLRLQFDWLGLTHDLNTGLRFHEDQIQRVHTEDNFNMVNARLVSSNTPTQVIVANTENSKVWSAYAQNSIKIDNWRFTAGLRVELIDSFYQNNLPGLEGDYLKKTQCITLPGASAYYSLSDHSAAFIGVHRGFVPTSPQQSPQLKIEDTYNWELGYRYQKQTTRIDLVGFYSDVKNLVESCTVSSSSNCNDANLLDQSFNSGRVEVYGVESILQKTFNANKAIDLPISFVYSYTQAEFKQGFSSDFDQWGSVESGDSVPYLADHQLTLDIGLQSNNWRTNLLARYVGEMNEAAGSDVDLSGVELKAQWVVDFSASYNFNDFNTVYLKVDNLLDEVDIVSRRPFGARPGKPRQFFVGYKYRWE